MSAGLHTAHAGDVKVGVAGMTILAQLYCTKNKKQKRDYLNNKSCRAKMNKGNLCYKPGLPPMIVGGIGSTKPNSPYVQEKAGIKKA